LVDLTVAHKKIVKDQKQKTSDKPFFTPHILPIFLHRKVLKQKNKLFSMLAPIIPGLVGKQLQTDTKNVENPKSTTKIFTKKLTPKISGIVIF